MRESKRMSVRDEGYVRHVTTEKSGVEIDKTERERKREKKDEKERVIAEDYLLVIEAELQG